MMIRNKTARSIYTGTVLLVLLHLVSAASSHWPQVRSQHQPQDQPPFANGLRALQPRDDCHGHFTCYTVERDGQPVRIYLDENYTPVEEEYVTRPPSQSLTRPPSQSPISSFWSSTSFWDALEHFADLVVDTQH